MEPGNGLSVLVTGGTGFLDRPLVEHLSAQGHRCTVLVRKSPPEGWAPPGVSFVPYGNAPWPRADAVINLAGDPIVGLWTARKRAAILSSRVEVTRRVVEWLKSDSQRPSVLLSASAVGYYGDRPGETLDEDSPPDPQRRFRWEVCDAWENEALRAEEFGVRTVLLRIGNVLHPSGGYLGRVLEFARRGLLFVPGRPEAFVSWIAREDAVRLVADLALTRGDCRGPLNLTAPEPIAQGALMRALAERVGRRVAGRMPAALLRATLGEFASAILDDQRVLPAKALRLGYDFRHPRAEDYLRGVLASAGRAG
jgi:uncharacterized protein (TIGR01777 family)